MESLQKYMSEYRKQLEKGDIQKAYQGLMEYILNLKTHFKNKYPDYFVSGSIYYGFMDMTYFSFTPVSLKQRNLKIAVVFVHPAFRFEVWLAGYNKQVQQQYWKLLKESNFKKYHIPLTAPEDDSIVDYILVDNPDFNDPQALTRQIEKGTLTFIKDIEDFLAKP